MFLFDEIVRFFSPPGVKQKRLALHRPVMTKAQFVKAIVDDGGDFDAAGIVWDKLQEWGLSGGFTPYPDDSFGDVYGTAEEELDEDIILDILNTLKLPIPDHKTTFSFGIIDTPRRVAEFISLVRQS